VNFPTLHTQPTRCYGSSKGIFAANDFAGTVRIPDYYSATFAISPVTKPLTKLNWALSKLPSTLLDTIGPLCDDPSIVDSLYVELQSIKGTVS
jgi:hypothetical protein